MIQGGWTQDVELWTWRADFKVLYRFSAVWGSVPLSLCCSEVNYTVISSFFLYNMPLCNGAMWCFQFLAIQFGHSVVSDSSRPHALQHTRLPCPSPTPGAYSNSCPFSQWCSNYIIHCRPLLAPSVFTSIRVFSSESVLCIRWPKYWNFSFSISPSNECSVLISFRRDWLDLLAVQGILKSLLQHHNSKASILWHSVFFIFQLLYPCMTTGNTITLTRWTFVGKVMFLLFNMLCRFVIDFLPRSKCLFISWLQSPSAVILKPRKNNVCHCFDCFPIYLP